jgi:hypothetical protein
MLRSFVVALHGLIAAVLLAGCATPSTTFRQDSVSRSLIHQSSGFAFPERIGSFLRTDAVQYDRAGLDVSASYNGEIPAVITVYVYPTNGLALSAEVARRRAEVMAGHSGATLGGQRVVQVTPANIDAAVVMFTFQDNVGGKMQELSSELVLAQRDPWFIAYRITYPKSVADLASEDAGKFLKTLSWP